jgi:hypothetical protein
MACNLPFVDHVALMGLENTSNIWETEKGAIGQKSPGPELANRGAGGGTSFIHGTGGPIPHAACHRVTGWPLRR